MGDEFGLEFDLDLAISVHLDYMTRIQDGKYPPGFELLPNPSMFAELTALRSFHGQVCEALRKHRG